MIKEKKKIDPPKYFLKYVLDVTNRAFITVGFQKYALLKV